MQSLAFLVRSVRQDSRLLSHHVMRAGMAAVILYLFFIQWQYSTLRVGAGGMFASEVMLCCYWFLTLLGSVHFSTAIVEEKEEQTLPLLRMTGASPLSILSGKSLPRLVVAILFLFAMAPFLILSISLGGVLPLGLVGAILSICCYAIMLSQLGLLASVLCRTATSAFTLTCVFWAGIELSHWWAGLADAYLGLDGAAYAVQSQYVLIGNLSGTLLAFEPSDLWFPHMTFHLVVAFVAFVFSWALFERFTSGSASDAPVAARAVTARRATSRVWDNAVSWKSWQHIAGGWRWIWIRAIGGTAGCVLVSVIVLAAFDAVSEPEPVAGMTMGFGIALLLINIARLGGKVFNAEIHEKTLAPLVMLPQRTSQTMFASVIGLLPAIGASAVAALMGFGFLALSAMASSSSDIGEVVEFFIQPWFLQLFSWVALAAHLGVLISTYVRYGGMLIAVAALSFGTLMFGGFSLGLLSVAGLDGNLIAYAYPIFLIVAELTGCIVIQQLLVRRLEVLAGK